MPNGRAHIANAGPVKVVISNYIDGFHMHSEGRRDNGMTGFVVGSDGSLLACADLACAEIVAFVHIAVAVLLQSIHRCFLPRAIHRLWVNLIAALICYQSLSARFVKTLAIGAKCLASMTQWSPLLHKRGRGKAQTALDRFLRSQDGSVCARYRRSDQD